MRPAGLGRLADAAARTFGVLGGAGVMMGVFSVLSFGFGLIVLAREYHRPKAVARATVARLLADWARAPDYLGLNLADYTDFWRRSGEPERPARLRDVRAALRRLGDDLDRQAERFPSIRVLRLDLTVAGTPTLATWRPTSGVLGDDADASTRIPLLEGGGLPEAALAVRYRVAPAVEQAAAGLERSYRRLLLALAGLSGSSLLFFGYMVLHARALRDRVAIEAAREATLDLADRTCHELGNGVFVLSNERRNLLEHLDLVDRFVAEEGEARASASRRVGLDPHQAARWEHALRREYADRGIDPDLELRRSAAIARQVCRQIGASAEYIALTVRELDGYLKHSALPVELGPVEVGPCLDEAVGLLGPKLQACDARVERTIEGAEALRVCADRRLLIHALVNLIKNAAEAASAAGRLPSIAITVRHDPAGGLVWIEVADNGPGLALADPARLFEGGVTTKGPGRGRGLAIVRESILAQGGQIEVRNRPGEGATFRVGLRPPPASAREGDAA